MIADDLSLDDLIALSLCNKTFYNALVEFRTKLNKSRQILSDYYREHFRQLQLSPDQRKQPIHPVETLCESVSDNNKTSKLKELEDLIKAGLDLDKRIVPVVLGVNHTIPRSGVSQTSVKIILKGFPISVGVLELLVARGAKIERSAIGIVLRREGFLRDCFHWLCNRQTDEDGDAIVATSRTSPSILHGNLPNTSKVRKAGTGLQRRNM